MKRPGYHVAPMLLDCFVYSLKVEINNRASGDNGGTGGHVVNLGLVRGKERQKVRWRWPGQWNNILIYLRSEQWLVCFWSTLSWMTPKQRGREQSHLQLLVTNMAVIRQ